MQMFRSTASAVAGLLILAACGGGNNGNPSVPPPVANTAPGIWEGTEAATGLKITCIVTETGEANFIRSDGVQYIGTVFVSGSTFSATFEGIPEFGSTFPDGSTYGTGTMTGTYVAQQTITATETFTTSAGTVTTGALPMTFDPNYNVESSTFILAGTYTDASTGVTLSITQFGQIATHNPITGCAINGYVSLVDGLYNVYGFLVPPTICQGPATVLNNKTFMGYGTLNNSVTPNHLIFGVSGGITADYGFVYSLDKSQ